MGNIIKIDSKYSLEIMKELIVYMNICVSEIDNIKSEILKLEKNDIWNNRSTHLFIEKSMSIMKEFLFEFENTNELFRNIIKQLNKYDEVEKSLIESLHGNMKI